jgi:hypothetical protein
MVIACHSRLTVVAIVLASVFGTGSAQQQPRIPPKYQAAPMYVAQLPQYCWNQYVDGSLGGYQYSIPHESCGYGMNHFCPALVFMLEAQTLSLPMNVRRGAIGNAIKEINYTLNSMKPGCFIAKDVHAALQQAQMLATIIK